MLDTDPRRKPGKKLLDATMVVKWAIIKLLITMHLAMPADIFTKAVDLMTNIPWVYRILSESRRSACAGAGRGGSASSADASLGPQIIRALGSRAIRPLVAQPAHGHP